MMIPLAVFCSAGAGSTRTLSAKGLKFTDIKNILSCWTLFEKHANCSFASKLHNGQKKCQYGWHTDIFKNWRIWITDPGFDLGLGLGLG
jgi:hypothetical protein